MFPGVLEMPLQFIFITSLSNKHYSYHLWLLVITKSGKIGFYGNITTVNFMIISTKLYVPVVTLSLNHNIKFLENIKQGFQRTISWNKYRPEITT